MSLERERKKMYRALRRRSGMDPAKSEELMRQVGGMDDWRVHCIECGVTIVGTPDLIEAHAEEHRRGKDAG